MDPTDRSSYVERYERRLREHGHSPLTLGWGRPGREVIRFRAMEDVVRATAAESLLDVGCGFADLREHLGAGGWAGAYTGIDIVPGLVAAAQDLAPGIDVTEADVSTYRPGESELFDVVVASGVFNARLVAEENSAHITRSVHRMFELARRAVFVDFMTTNVDYQHQDAWHTDPAWSLELAQSLTRRFELRHDYLPFEFALVLYRDERHAESVFLS